MAKQIGEIKITGTVADITFYQMEGQYYARRKSSLKGSRVKKDPRFRRTMEWAQRLALASQLASRVYRSLPREERGYALYKELKSRAIRALKEGRSEEEVRTRIWEDVRDLREQAEQRDSQGETAVGRCCGRKEARRQRAAPGNEPLLVDAGGRLVGGTGWQQEGRAGRGYLKIEDKWLGLLWPSEFRHRLSLFG